MKKNDKSYKAKVSEYLTKAHSEKRFVVIDTLTNEVIDDNKGEGFRTEDKAIVHYELKQFGKTNKSKDKHIGKVNKYLTQKASDKRKIEIDEDELDE